LIFAEYFDQFFFDDFRRNFRSIWWFSSKILTDSISTIFAETFDQFFFVEFPVIQIRETFLSKAAMLLWVSGTNWTSFFNLKQCMDQGCQIFLGKSYLNG
jgi:hypothetical protein